MILFIFDYFFNLNFDGKSREIDDEYLGCY